MKILNSVEDKVVKVQPSCVVLLAMYNGSRWIQEQIDTILAQRDVYVDVIVSDDCSTDSSKKIVRRFSAKGHVTLLSTTNQRHGSAGRNFQSLIRNADIGAAEYVALSDQDDVWFYGKLSRAVSVLRRSNSDGYSSNVEAFWENGRKKLIYKSQSQKTLDHLFSSPGPGCTFVFTRRFFICMQREFIKNENEFTKVNQHDWLIYAYAKQLGYRWVIDDYVSVRYRQHDANEVGANSGVKGKRWRMMRCLKGFYITDVLLIGKALNFENEIILHLERFSLSDRLWLARRSYNFRRGSIDWIWLTIVFLISRKHIFISNRLPTQSFRG